MPSEVRKSAAAEIVSKLTYIQDQTTHNCFAVIRSVTFNEPYANYVSITWVPCSAEVLQRAGIETVRPGGSGSENGGEPSGCQRVPCQRDVSELGPVFVSCQSWGSGWARCVEGDGHVYFVNVDGRVQPEVRCRE